MSVIYIVGASLVAVVVLAVILVVVLQPEPVTIRKYTRDTGAQAPDEQHVPCGKSFSEMMKGLNNDSSL